MKTELPTPSLIHGSTRYASPSAASPMSAPNGVTPRPSIASLEARVRCYDSDIDARSDTFRAAVLLLAAIEYGLNVDALARRTGYPRPFVAKWARRLIDNGVWTPGGLATNWSPAEGGCRAFWNDVAVAEGKLCRRVKGNGEVEWAPPGFWNKSYEFIDAAAKAQLGTVYRDPTAITDAPPEAEDDEDDGERDSVVPPRSTTPLTEPPADIAPPAAPAPETPVAPTPSAPAEPEPSRADAPPVRRPAPVTPWPARPPSRPPAEIFPDTVWIG